MTIFKGKMQWIWLVGAVLAVMGISYGLAVQVGETQTVMEMNAWRAALLGTIQGLTEFLPISSSGHLKVIPMVLKLGDPGVSVIAIVQLGSILAVLWYFRKDLWQLTANSLQALVHREYGNYHFRMSLGIAFGTIPICVLGFCVKYFFAETYECMRSFLGIGIASIVMSFLLLVAERKGKRDRDFEKISLWDGVLIGCAQALALFPGVSRSGSTLTAALFLNLKREDAARFSFLLGIPAITLAGLVELKDLLTVGNLDFGSLVVALIFAAFVSYLSIAWMIRYLQTHSSLCFVVYRLLFGIFLIVWYFAAA